MLKIVKKMEVKLTEYVQYFCEEFQKSDSVQQYVKSRGINNAIAEQFRLGYCPPTPEYSVLQRFHDRLIFPIWDQHSHLVGWTGRTLISAPAKYLNVYDSLIFKKMRILYAYNFAKATIFQTKEAILVEGQTDAIALHQEGIINTVASSGASSFQEVSARLLARLAQKVYIIFDGDEPGIKAALAAKIHLTNVGVDDITIVELPTGEDPASYILKHGKYQFMELFNGK